MDSDYVTVIGRVKYADEFDKTLTKAMDKIKEDKRTIQDRMLSVGDGVLVMVIQLKRQAKKKEDDGSATIDATKDSTTGRKAKA